MQIGAQASAPRAAIYLRVSTGRQAEQDLSIPDQKAQTRAWAAQRGWTVVAEYVEPGASATDDKRPEFQRMIERACDGENAFDVIVVHSFSRFFRDAFGLEFYVRKLAKHGVRLVSITQELGDDPAQVMMRQVIALFDEYQSKENAKHVLRAMKENARQGFWNGSCPPLGYRTVEAERRGGAGQEETRRRSGRGGAGATHFQTVHRGPPGLRPDGNQDHRDLAERAGLHDPDRRTVGNEPSAFAPVQSGLCRASALQRQGLQDVPAQRRKRAHLLRRAGHRGRRDVRSGAGTAQVA
jgi:DNA invertase Pin-like site-specific DNA recombinase